ncbi:TPA: hypothetical protein ACH3X1_016595 [Trebouxia sp. C0004]
MLIPFKAHVASAKDLDAFKEVRAGLEAVTGPQGLAPMPTACTAGNVTLQRVSTLAVLR